MAAKDINKQEFEQLTRGEKAVLVDFWAPWCGYCRRIAPAYEKIAGQYEQLVTAVKLNIDEEPEVARNEQIEVIPTLVLYRDGKALGSVVAPESKAMIEAFIREALEQ